MTRSRLLRWLVRGLLGLSAGPLLYLVAAAVGGAIPANRGWIEAKQGVRIYVADNGVHTDLIVPVVAEGIDWRDLARAEHVRNPMWADASHLAFGWGDRGFYLDTPEWSAMRPSTAINAVIGGGPTVLHVAHLREPVPGPAMRPLTLRPEEYRRLAAYIRASFAPGTILPGYRDHDAFYPATGRYSAINSCNEWTGRGLRAAGVRTGAWTPLAFSVMLWR